MNYYIDSSNFHQNGTIPKYRQQGFNKETVIITYLKNRERSSGYKYLIGSGHMRTAVLVNFCRRVLGVKLIPDLDTMLCLSYDNIGKFKAWITLSISDGTIFMTSKEYQNHLIKSVTELKS